MEDQSAIKGKFKYKKGMGPKISHFFVYEGDTKREEKERRREEEEEEEEKWERYGTC